ncbi:related to CDC14-dual specificity phosphatase [Sporisorium scitamineum]|uniref:protein-tyrosine-phosphatase n=1 Tax=Sporisorium scitamineum TaxID=49012 RepID=A0A127ZEV0_9BASI|nr:related to CDC14-dual specificity phosphatase [Sporisorium scitamineum]
MASTSAFVLEERQAHIIAPDDSDFLDSDAENSCTPHPDGELIESAMLEDPAATPHRSSRQAARQTSPHKLWPAHPLIRIHKRLWFTYFNGDLPSEDDLNENDGQAAARKNFNDEEIKKYVDPSETNPSRLHWFNIDHDLVYLSFWFDWGPLNVGMFYRFCLHVHHMLTDPDMQDATLVLYTTDVPAQKANAALLVTLYAMIIGKVTPADAFYPISELEFKPFRDAGYGRADYNLSIQDILYGVHRAINEGLLDLTTFNLDEYEKYEQVSNGDWNWITPNFIAFASPNDRNYVEALRLGEGRLPESYSFRPPGEDKLFGKTIRYFKDRGVKLVVRLNNPLYDREAFLNAGIDHSDMYFDDGSNPTDEILTEFIAKADKVIAQDGVVAVHCKAGLGRTGVLIGAYLVWKHGFSAGEAIGFMRFMRPGCVVGPQQHFMYQNFVEWIKWGVRDHAMNEARQLIAAERAKIEAAAQAAANAAAVANAASASTATAATPASRASIKRRAAGSDADKHAAQDDSFELHTDADDSLDEDIKHAHRQTRKKLDDQDEQTDGSDDEDEQRPRQKQKADVASYVDVNGGGPVTPKAQRGTSRMAPASAAPGVKPAPCVGQPRKSPSPTRKRPAIQAPATVARLELTSRRYPAATRSFNSHLMLSSQSVHLDALPQSSSSSGLSVPVVASGGRGGMVPDDADENLDDDEKVHGGGHTASVDGGATAAGVLVESRINVSPTTTPRASPKAAMVNLTPSPVARVRGFESRTRSNTIATPVRGSSRRDPTVSPSPKPEVFRASPNIRDRYGLRDSSQSPSPPSVTASPRASIAASPVTTRVAPMGSRHASPVKVAPSTAVVSSTSMAHMSDAEVLGVIDVIPQHVSPQRVSTRRPSPSPSSAKAKVVQPETSEGKIAGDDENTQLVQAPVVVHRAPLTASVSTVQQGPKVLRSVKSKPTLLNGVSSSTSGARVATVRKPISARPIAPTPIPAGGGGGAQRSVSAKLTPTVRPTTVRAQKSVADLRASTTSAPRTARTVSSSSSSSTTATVNNSSRPASRLTAPTAASAARAAAAVAKRAAVAPGVAKVGARKVSAALGKGGSAGAVSRRGRRSSTGEAGLDVVA